jgi:FtsP/CotA-like multicopper oxidase with cupredoxin domain
MLTAIAALAGCSRMPLCGPAAAVREAAIAWPFSSSDRALASPPELRAEGGVVAASLDAVLDARGGPAFAYAGSIGVAPTLRAHPGDTIRLALHNALPPGGMHAGVNIHFHGLTVSPNAPGDDSIGTIARPGQTVRYIVKIPAGQEPGLYWYHPHVHGTTFEQVAAGMSGAIVIEGIERRFPALAGMREQILMIRDVPVRAHSMQAGSAPVVDDDNEGGDPCRPDPEFRTEVDGAARPFITIRAGERQFFRVVNASAQRYFDLSIPGVSLQLVALDGVALQAYPGAAAVRAVSHVTVPPAGRAEFVVTGPRRRAVLRSGCVDSGPAGDAQPAAELADLGDPQAPDAGPYQPEPPPQTLHAAGAQRDEPLPEPARRRTLRLTEDARHFFINGRTYDPAGRPAIVARAGTAEVWTILNDTEEVHAFHVHQVHFAVESIDGKAPAYRAWLDVVSVPSRIHHYGGSTTPGSVTLLVDFRNPVIRGVFLYHCHILDHEDRGMMAKIAVL